MDDPKIVEIPSLFQNRIAKKLTFDKQKLTIEKVNSFDGPVLIAAGDIAALRCGAVML